MAARRGESSLGERVRELREARGWTKQGLAERAGLHSSVVTAVEAGVTVPSGQDIVQRLAAAFGLTPAELVGEE